MHVLQKKANTEALRRLMCGLHTRTELRIAAGDPRPKLPRRLGNLTTIITPPAQVVERRLSDPHPINVGSTAKSLLDAPSTEPLDPRRPPHLPSDHVLTPTDDLRAGEQGSTVPSL